MQQIKRISSCRTDTGHQGCSTQLQKQAAQQWRTTKELRSPKLRLSFM